MAPKDKKDTDSKIKFFKIDQIGDIAPAFPDDAGERLDRLEPIFTPDAQPTETPELAVPQNNAADSKLEEQLHLLKPQVEDISRIPEKQTLTADQIEILKNYIVLKESEVRDLREQQRQYQAYLKKISSQLETHTRKNRNAVGELESLKQREEALRNEVREIREKHQNEIVLLKNDHEEKLRSSGNYESQVDDLVKKREEWRDKLKEDLKRIKLKEREMDNKYELLRRDTQALLDSKDKHVLELKKKNDALELELESLEERLRKGNTVLGTIDAKKRRLVETMKLAITLLEEIDNADAKADDDRKAG